MENKCRELIDKLAAEHSLTLAEYEYLIENYSEKDRFYAAEKAVKARREIYGNSIYIRGLIEISNICRNNCLYCGIRGGNSKCERYRLTPEEILDCCDAGYDLGFRTFVLQGGEDGYFTDEVLVPLIEKIKSRYPDCAVTLSLGERSFESYKKLRAAGADRYLLRHETADREHYGKLHPTEMSFDNRMECLKNLKALGFQVGCGFMVGAPYSSAKTLAKDLKFIEEFRPEMCGIGPYLTHKDTPFCDKENGSLELTLFLLSVVRLIKPDLLLPATTALGTIREGGREMGIKAGGNVVMPNLSPKIHREKYLLYNDKIATGVESAEGLDALKESMQAIGYEVVISRGDNANVSRGIIQALDNS